MTDRATGTAIILAAFLVGNVGAVRSQKKGNFKDRTSFYRTKAVEYLRKTGSLAKDVGKRGAPIYIGVALVTAATIAMLSGAIDGKELALLNESVVRHGGSPSLDVNALHHTILDKAAPIGQEIIDGISQRADLARGELVGIAKYGAVITAYIGTVAAAADKLISPKVPHYDRTRRFLDKAGRKLHLVDGEPKAR